MSETFTIVNACEFEGEIHSYRSKLFFMWAGQVSTTSAWVWADHFEEAFEHFFDWLDEEGKCGFFVSLDEDDLKEAAKDLKLAWLPGWPDYSDSNFEKVIEKAEEGLTVLGWTSHNCGQYTQSHEWGGDHITIDSVIEEVARRSLYECYEHSFLPGDVVWYDDPEEDAYDWGVTGRYTIKTVSNEQIEIENATNEVTVDSEGIVPYDEAKHGPRWAEITTKAASLPSPAVEPAVDVERLVEEIKREAPQPTPDEEKLIAWMLLQRWYPSRAPAVAHVLRMRKEGLSGFEALLDSKPRFHLLSLPSWEKIR